jgi:hypothetical protein
LYFGFSTNNDYQSNSPIKYIERRLGSSKQMFDNIQDTYRWHILGYDQRGPENNKALEIDKC